MNVRQGLGRFWRVLPLVAVLGLMALFAMGLRQDPRALPSALLNRPAPVIEAAQLHDPDARFDSRTLAGSVWVLHVWASWCETCRAEHATVQALAQDGVPIYGLNYKDHASAAQAWLARQGNPYRVSVADADGRIGMDYGVYGVPETFIMDAQGRVRYRHAGPLTDDTLRRHIRPLLRELTP